MIQRYDGSPKSSKTVVYCISGTYEEILTDLNKLTNTLWTEYNFKLYKVTTTAAKETEFMAIYHKQK